MAPLPSQQAQASAEDISALDLASSAEGAGSREAQEQAQSRRLEALGRLTAGIAHDFNNLLTVIMSATDSLALQSRDEASRDLAMVSLAAAERGADLVRRLLTFSSRPRLASQAIDAPDTVAALARLLQRTLPDDIAFEIDAPQVPIYCLGDRCELEAALLNLCVNARDAMPAGGRLRLSLKLAEPDARSAADLGLKPGAYALFSVTDSGIGMSPATLERAIEPFFTTKADSGGTGLGLSGAHGFARGHGGALLIASEEGRGSVVSLYLPLAKAASQGELELLAPPASAEGCDVLLVEDNAAVRAQATRLLADLGCRVTPVSNAAAALEYLAIDRPVDLMITDLQLTGRLNGRELASEALIDRPDLKVLYMSGSLDVLGADAPGGQAPFLAKPFGRAQLAAAVSQALARYAAAPSPQPSRRKASARRTKDAPVMGKKVLIIEDDPALLALMGDAFTHAGMDALLARNGQVGIELFDVIQPDLVITDIVMPAKEGVSVILDIRKSLSDTPLIAISGGGVKGAKSYLHWARELGADMVVPKPFRVSILLMIANQLLSEAEQRRIDGLPPRHVWSAQEARSEFLYDEDYGAIRAN